MPKLQWVTDKTIANAKAGEHGVEPNLTIRVSKTGAKGWIFRWFKAGTVKKLSLGSYPTVSLAKVREQAKLMRGDIAEGRDPAERLDRHKPKAKTFRTYALAYIAEHESGWRNEKHKQQWRNTLETYVYPAIGDKPVSEITAGDIHQLLLPLWAVKTETATRLRMRIETVLNYAFVNEGIDRRNPAVWKANLKHLLPNPRKVAKANGKLKSHAAPPWRDVPAIYAKLAEKPDVMSALLLRWSLLTACRSMEARAATFDEVEGNVWTLAAHRTKNGQSHTVPLSSEAMNVLELAAKLKREGSNLIFPGPKSILSDVAINKQLHSIYANITAHGIARSSFRDWAAEKTQFSDKVAEAALNHTNPNETEAAYLRTKFLNERAKLMEVWAIFISNNNSNIIDFSKHASK